MADKKISALDAASSTDGTEVLPIVQSATTKKLAISKIKDYISANLGAATASRLSLSGNVSSTAWTTSGIGVATSSRTLTDTSSSGTVAAAYTNVLGGNTIAASNSTTFTEYGSLFLGSPTAGTNVTITAGYSLITGGHVKIGGSVVPATNTVDSVGYTGMPSNSQSASYTTVASDAGKVILHPSTDDNARTFTIAANSSVAYPIGTVLTFVNMKNTVTIAVTSDTLTLASSGATGSRTLAVNGMATAIKVASTVWLISGNGLT